MPELTDRSLARCKTCGRLRPSSALDRSFRLPRSLSNPAPQEEEDFPPLFAIDEFEYRAVLAAEIPPHPATTFDEPAWRAHLAASFTLTGEEKLEILACLPNYTQAQVDGLFRICSDDIQRMAALNRRHQAKLAALAQEHAEALDRLQLDPLPEGRGEPDLPLSPTECARVLRIAIVPLLRSLGPGDARCLMASLLERIAAQVAAGQAAEVRGLLPEVFQPELRTPELNALAHDPSKDADLLDSLIRPTISRLRALQPSAFVRAADQTYRASLVLAGPERSRGPVRQPYRIALQLHPHRTDALGTFHYRTRLFPRILQIVSRQPGLDALPLSRFGPFGPIASRAVEIRGYADASERAVLRLRVAVALLDHVLPLLDFDEKACFLASLLDVSLRAGPDRPRFDDWFLQAIVLATTEDDEPFADAFLRMLLELDELSFAEKVAAIGHYRRLPADDRDRGAFHLLLKSALSRAVVPDADLLDVPPVDLESLLPERVLHPEDFLRTVGRDLERTIATP